MRMIFPGVYEIPAQHYSMQERQALEEKRKQIFKRIDDLECCGKDHDNKTRNSSPAQEAEKHLYCT